MSARSTGLAPPPRPGAAAIAVAARSRSRAALLVEASQACCSSAPTAQAMPQCAMAQTGLLQRALEAGDRLLVVVAVAPSHAAVEPALRPRALFVLIGQPNVPRS